MAWPVAWSRLPVGSSAKHDGRAAHQRSGDGNPLALPARELVGLGLGPAIKPDHG